MNSLALIVIGLALLVLVYARTQKKLSASGPQWIRNRYLGNFDGTWINPSPPLGRYAIDSVTIVMDGFKYTAVQLADLPNPSLHPYKITFAAEQSFVVGTVINCTQVDNVGMTINLVTDRDPTLFPFNQVLHDTGTNKGIPMLAGFFWQLPGKFSPLDQYIIPAPFTQIQPVFS